MLRLKWYLIRWLKPLGWAGWLGILLLVGCVIFGLASLIPAKHRLNELGAETLAVKQPNLPKRGGTITKAVKLEKFKAHFPEWSTMPDQIARVYAIAQAENIHLERCDGILSEGPEGDLMKYEIALPITAGYVQIRNFMIKLMEEIPTAAVDEINFKREAINNPTINAQMKLTLYFRDAS